MKKLHVYTSKPARSSLSFCEEWLCGQEEVCEGTWTVEHAKRDAQNTLSMHPGKSLSLWKFHYYSVFI